MARGTGLGATRKAGMAFEEEQASLGDCHVNSPTAPDSGMGELTKRSISSWASERNSVFSAPKRFTNCAGEP